MTGGEDVLMAGWAAFRSGRPAEAESAARTTLGAGEGGADAWLLLGAACHGQGRPGEAVECYQQVLRVRPNDVVANNDLGNALREIGRSAEAVECLTKARTLRPDVPQIHNNLGTAFLNLGRSAEAEECFRRALGLWPEYPEAHNNLGNALRNQGRPSEAGECYNRALGLRPDYAEAHNNFGNALLDQGQPQAGADAYRRAFELRPDFPEGHNNLGNVLRELGQLDEAETCFRRALELRPDSPEAGYNLGSVLRDRGQSTPAELCFRRVLQLRPDYPAAWNNLGNALLDQDRLAEAEECYRQAIRHCPDYPEAINNLGNALWNRGKPGEAEQVFRQALRLRPDYPEAFNNLGFAMLSQGDPLAAYDAFGQARALRPNYAKAHSNQLQALQYRPGVTAKDLAAAHADYQRIHAAPLRSKWPSLPNDRDPERPLRLGLISPDLGRHPVGFFSIRAVEALARGPDAIICYSDRHAPADEITQRFRSAAQTWRDVAGLRDEQLTNLVRADAIDILIDLCGHTGGNRMLVFARRPAPVQCTWLGYEGTTGLEAMDYLIADERLIPPGSELYYRERVLRLAGGYASYEPLPDAPDPGPPPMAASGHVTFGCFNNPAKLSDEALAAFAEVLRRLPGSHLVLQYRGLNDPVVSSRLQARLAAAGIEPGRAECRGATDHAAYLAAYQNIDIALDPWPFGGGVTTCDALWMGVPVVTLPGDTFAGRHGLSHLHSAGLGRSLAARDVSGYVALAADVASDRDRLAEFRSAQRRRMSRSPLCDGKRLADELLEGLRDAWREWAAGRTGTN